MFGLIPKDEKFFDMFRLMGTIIIDGAQQLKDMLDDYSDPLTSQRAIKDTEHKGDSQTHEIIRRLNKTFITPFDREDIYALAGALDDILDLIDASAQRLVMYNVDPAHRRCPQAGRDHPQLLPCRWARPAASGRQGCRYLRLLRRDQRA